MDPLHPEPGHDLYACELSIGGSSSTVAVAMRQEHARRRDAFARDPSMCFPLALERSPGASCDLVQRAAVGIVKRSQWGVAFGW